MARSARGRRMLSSHLRSSPYPLPSCRRGMQEKTRKHERPSKVIKKDWEDATCSVCMEFPHNAVLLLCSSHDKGCRPYMCGTSYRYSNCLDQFTKAYMKVENQGVGSGAWPLSGKSEATELVCPLCRGPVKGWTVVEPAREYLNAKKRSCMQDNCTFSGTYKELRKHVRAKHPSAKPRQVDPLLEQKWRSLEREREREDVISTIRSSTPGAMVLGDYVIENNVDYDSDEAFHRDDDYGGRRGMEENWFNFLFLLQAFGNSNTNLASRLRRSQRGFRLLDGEDGNGGLGPHPSSIVNEQHHPVNMREGDEEEDDDDDGDGPVVLRQGRGVIEERMGRRRRRRSRSRLGIGLT